MGEQISLLRVTLLILDGVDRVLELGFAKQVGDITGWVRPERQTVLLAATWPKPAADLAKELCFSGGPPVQVQIAAVAPGAAPRSVKRPLEGGKGGKPAKRLAAAPKAAASKAKAAEPAAPENAEDFLDEW